jgi:glycine betaine catabolism B
MRFVRSEQETDAVGSFYFLPHPRLQFRSGQYLLLKLPHAEPDERGVERSFTIASAPSDPLVRLTTVVGEQRSTFKHTLSSLPPGSSVDASGPYGDFVFPDTDLPVVLIAGGVGITPFRSMLGDLRARASRPSLTLLYSNSTPDFAFGEFFDGLRPGWPELRLAYTVTRPSSTWQGWTGRIDAEFIRRHVQRPWESVYLVCGPAGLVESVRGSLSALGVSPELVKHEHFPGYEHAPSPAAAA